MCVIAYERKLGYLIIGDPYTFYIWSPIIQLSTKPRHPPVNRLNLTQGVSNIFRPDY